MAVTQAAFCVDSKRQQKNARKTVCCLCVCVCAIVIAAVDDFVYLSRYFVWYWVMYYHHLHHFHLHHHHYHKTYAVDIRHTAATPNSYQLPLWLFYLVFIPVVHVFPFAVSYWATSQQHHQQQYGKRKNLFTLFVLWALLFHPTNKNSESKKNA